MRFEATDVVVCIFLSYQYCNQIVKHLNKPNIINIEIKSERKIRKNE